VLEDCGAVVEKFPCNAWEPDPNTVLDILLGKPGNDDSCVKKGGFRTRPYVQTEFLRLIYRISRLIFLG
jgi:hypothetical protein